jgi:hypothetical protein
MIATSPSLLTYSLGKRLIFESLVRVLFSCDFHPYLKETLTCSFDMEWVSVGGYEIFQVDTLIHDS